MRSLRKKQVVASAPEPPPAAKQPEAEPETQTAPAEAHPSSPVQAIAGSPTRATSSPAGATASSPARATTSSPARATASSPARANASSLTHANTSSPARANATVNTEATGPGAHTVECVARLDASTEHASKVTASATVVLETREQSTQQAVDATQVDGPGEGGVSEDKIQEDLDRIALAQMVQEVLRRPATCDLEFALHAALGGTAAAGQAMEQAGQPQQLPAEHQPQQVPQQSVAGSPSRFRAHCKGTSLRL